jgi:hypothetical protein
MAAQPGPAPRRGAGRSDLLGRKIAREGASRMSTIKNTLSKQLTKILTDVFRRHVDAAIDAAIVEVGDILQEEFEQHVQDRVTELREQLVGR